MCLHCDVQTAGRLNNGTASKGREGGEGVGSNRSASGKHLTAGGSVRPQPRWLCSPVYLPTTAFGGGRYSLSLTLSQSLLTWRQGSTCCHCYGLQLAFQSNHQPMIYIAVFLSRDISWITNISVVCYQQTLSTSLQCPTATDGRGSDAETSATTASCSAQRKPTTDADLSSAVARRSADIRLVRIVKRWLRKRTGKSTSPQRGRQGMISESSEGRSACCLLGEITRRQKPTTDCTTLCCGYRCMWSQGSCSSRRLRSTPDDVVAHQRCLTMCCPADSDDERDMSCKSYRTTVGRRRTTGEHSNLIYSCCCSRRRTKQRQSSGKRHSDSDADDDELRRLTESEQHSSSTAEVVQLFTFCHSYSGRKYNYC